MFAFLLAACSVPPGETVVWAGWNTRWASLSHRLSRAAVVLEPDGGALLALGGGDWAAEGVDAASYRVRLARLSAPGLLYVHGETELDVGPDGFAVAEEEVRVDGAADRDLAVVLLSGFDIDTDTEQPAGYPEDYDPALGYTSRGFGFRVSPPAREGDTLTFEVRAEVRWGHSDPEDPIDRSAMDAAIPHAHTCVVVAWTALAMDGTAAVLPVEGGLDYPFDGSYSEQPPVEIDLPLDAPAVGLRAVDLRVRVDDDPTQGAYLRSHGAEVSGAPGARSLVAEATNSSLVETADISFEFAVEAVGLSPAGGEAERLRFEGDLDPGEARLGPDEAAADD